MFFLNLKLRAWLEPDSINHLGGNDPQLSSSVESLQTGLSNLNRGALLLSFVFVV